ncbi:MAG: formate--tetrahydrofolate ligase [Christensenellales bacterium]|jgi:formate--tetrahydrofolate ligase
MQDIQIAQAADIWPIAQIAQKAGIPEEVLSPYGRYIAKVDPLAYADKAPKAKLVLVTAITPTPAGEGKTTVSIALADGLTRTGRKAMLALREPSLGPVFGMKGGATGGGYAQVLPMENINLHFTGDLHAITAANNLLAAMVDNHIQQGNQLGIDPRKIMIRRCMDVNDRQLRSIVSGLGGTANGMPREDGFDITAASQVMATFCMAADLTDLHDRLSRIVVARTYDNKLVTCADIGAAGAMCALLRDAMMPNLVQTIDHTPCLMHGGPFANIAHGCNSVIATTLAMKMADYVVTEAGFGADLGAEKFIDIKCRATGLWPDCVVLVATIRALKHHGGVLKDDLNKENVDALNIGMDNLKRHIRNVREVWGIQPVVAVNRFASDTQAEIDALLAAMAQMGVPRALTEGWAHGGAGATELAELVAQACGSEEAPSRQYTYEADASLQEKVEAVARRVYGADGVTWAGKTLQMLKELTDEGYGSMPVCIAKTQYSFSDEAKLINAPQGFAVTIRDIRLSAGAGFVVAFAGDIIAMPGLSRKPAALNVSVSPQGVISGLM